MVNMKPLVCKYCGEEKLILHDSLNVFNPEIDEDEIKNNVYECTECGTLFYEEEDFSCILITVNPIKSSMLNIGESK